MKLIHNWRHWWRMWSTWLHSAAAVFLIYLAEVPDATIQIWSILPADIRAAIDPQYVKYIAVALIALGVLARLIRQPKLAAEARQSIDEG